jgi:hypothetical protein
MGEAKHRKRLDPNYGRQSELLVQTLLQECTRLPKMLAVIKFEPSP